MTDERENEFDLGEMPPHIKNLKAIVRGMYDIQKLRIQTGNRLVGNYKANLGLKPSVSEEEGLSEEAKELIAALRSSYRRLTDGMVRIPRKKHFKGDKLISDYTEFALIHQYFTQEKDERDHKEQLEDILEDFPLYTTYLKKITGVGAAIAGIIITEINIRRAKYPSSIIMFSGLDVGPDGWGRSRRDEHLVLRAYEPKPGSRKGRERILKAEKSLETLRKQKEDLLEQGDVEQVRIEMQDIKISEAEYELEHAKDLFAQGLEERKSITFNPFLKTKMMGVLAPSLLRGIKCGTCGQSKKAHEICEEFKLNEAKLPKKLCLTCEASEKAHIKKTACKLFELDEVRSRYAKIYYDYRHRLENDDYYGEAVEKDKKWKEMSISERPHRGAPRAHRHEMSLRYMVKQFLIDLYKEWRTLEGLEVHPPYSEAKLGHMHEARGERGTRENRDQRYTERPDEEGDEERRRGDRLQGEARGGGLMAAPSQLRGSGGKPRS